jgi:Uma2 family endonuclease
MQSQPTPPADRPLTHHDLDQMPDDGNRYEVIDGVLHVTPFPGFAHQRAATRLTSILERHVFEHKLGEVFTQNTKVVLDVPTGVGPDVVYVSSAKMPGMQRDGFYGAPDLLVEVVSSKPALDRVVKLQKYAQAGVPHYWIVDPEDRSVLVYRLEAGTYRIAAALKHDDRFEPELFPGLAIDLGVLWV